VKRDARRHARRDEGRTRWRTEASFLGEPRRMHVDAAYAGVAALLPEQRAGLDGLELADSFDTNCHKCARSGTRKLQSSAPLHSLTAFVCKSTACCCTSSCEAAPGLQGVHACRRSEGMPC